MNAMERIKELARETPQRIAFPEADDPTMLEAAYELVQQGFGTGVLVGSEAALRDGCRKHGCPEDAFGYVDAGDAEQRERLAVLYESVPGSFLRGRSLRRRMEDPVYLAMVMQAVGEVDVAVCGFTAPTAKVIQVASEVLGLEPGNSLVSSVGFVEVPGYEGEEGNLLALSDVGCCPNPTAEELAAIAIASCDTVRDMTGWEPRAALISFSSDGSSDHQDAEKVRQAVRIARGQRPDLCIDGEFQLDSAVNPLVARKKVKRNSDVAGRANILVFPCLNTGNTVVKALVELAHADLYGVIMQGFRQAASDFSRGARKHQIVGSVALACVYAASRRRSADCNGAERQV